MGLADKKKNKSSDPPHNSADGAETRHYKGEGEDNSVKYKTNQPLDHDIVTTHHNLKEAEKKKDIKIGSSSNIQVEVDSGHKMK